jgi:predicted MarR family transcription regulator
MIDFKKIAKKEIDDALERMRKARHRRCAALIVQWLMERARKKSVPDLAQRIDLFTKDVYKMCEAMRIEYEKGAFVVKVTGSAEQTYKMLRLGSNWFEPDADVVIQIMAGLDEQFGS